MKITYCVGDLLESGLGYIAHGCNAQRTMGSGIAYAIKMKFTYAYTTYMFSSMEMGSVNTAVGDINQPIVFNCITQERFGRDKNVVYCDYNAIRKCIQTINKIIKDVNPGTSVGFPLIGAGLANGDWKVISKIIEEESTDFIPVVYVLDEKTLKEIQQ